MTKAEILQIALSRKARAARLDDINFAIAVIEYLQNPEVEVAPVPARKPMLALPAPPKACPECARRKVAHALRMAKHRAAHKAKVEGCGTETMAGIRAPEGRHGRPRGEAPGEAEGQG